MHRHDECKHILLVLTQGGFVLKSLSEGGEQRTPITVDDERSAAGLEGGGDSGNSGSS